MHPMYSEIDKRWKSRVVPNNWHTMGKEGARAYLKKYGKNIGQSKVDAFYEYATVHGAREFAEGIREFSKSRANQKSKTPIPPVSIPKTVTPIVCSFDTVKNIWNKEIIENYKELLDLYRGFKHLLPEKNPFLPFFVECPISHLVEIGAGTMIGGLPNSAWKGLGTNPNFNDLVVRTVLCMRREEEILDLKIPSFWQTGSCDIQIQNLANGTMISNLIRKNDGVLKMETKSRIGVEEFIHFGF